MKQNWSESELIESWDLTDSERNLLDQRTEHGLLGFAILLKFFQLEGRFPLNHKEVPSVVVKFMAGICCLPVSAWNEFSFKGRSGERTRAQIRDFLGFRPATLADGAQIQAWLCQEVIPHDQEPRHLRAGVFDWCREHRIEPPTHDRIDRLIGAAVHTFENEFFQGIKSKLPTETLSHLEGLLSTKIQEDPEVEGEPENQTSVFSILKTDPGRVGLASVKNEIAKLSTIQGLQLPDNLFTTNTSQKVLKGYRLRAATESAWQIRRHPETIRYALLATFCWQRRREIIDSLMDLLIQIIHRISVRAEKKVYAEMIGDLDKVDGKNRLLFRLAEAAIKQPEGMVKDVLFPVVDEETGSVANIPQGRTNLTLSLSLRS